VVEIWIDAIDAVHRRKVNRACNATEVAKGGPALNLSIAIGSSDLDGKSIKPAVTGFRPGSVQLRQAWSIKPLRVQPSQVLIDTHRQE